MSPVGESGGGALLASSSPVPEARMRIPWRAVLRDLGDLLLPPACPACRRPVAQSLDPVCGACAARLRGEVDEAPEPAPAPLARWFAGAIYAGDALDVVQRFKYPEPGLAGLDPRNDAVACWLALEAARAASPEAPGLVVPVPLHPRRLRSRGFNPACVLARHVASRLALPLDPVALERVRDTPSQTSLGRSARARNVRDAFRVRAGRSLPRCVWLVDDVVTTGATLCSAARALRRGGARSVVAICAARALRGQADFGAGSDQGPGQGAR